MNQHKGKKESAIAKIERIKALKQKRERAAKIKEIKKRIALQVPEYRFEIPPEVPKVGSKEYERWMNPWRFVGQNSPGFAGSPVRTAKELQKLKKANKEEDKESDNESIIEVSSDDSDDDSEDERYKRKIRKQNAKRKKRKEERIAKEKEGTYEDFVIPNIIDAQTGKKVELTKSFWSSEEGRINRDTQGILDEQTGRLFFNAKEDYGHYVVNSMINKKPFSRGDDSSNSSRAKGQKTGAGGGGRSGVLSGGGSGSSTEGEGKAGGRKDASEGRQGAHGHGVHFTGGYSGPGGFVSGEGRPLSPLMVDTSSRKGHHHHHHGHHHVHHTHSTLETVPDVINPNMTRHKHLLDAEKRFLAGLPLHRVDTSGEVLDHHEHHNPLHHLHLNIKGESAKHVHVHHHDDKAHHVHQGDMNTGHNHVQHAHRRMNDLVARFLRDGPIRPMYHVHWEKGSNTIQIPEGYVNDEDGDAESYVSHVVSGGASPTSSYSSYSSTSTSRRTSISSVGFDSFESNSRLGSKRERSRKAGRPPSASPRSAKRDLQSDLKKNGGDDTSKTAGTQSDIESVSVLSDALDPKNDVMWAALEEKYYQEIRDMAVEYEINKIRTHEKPIKGGPEGMEIRCREYASWKARVLKFIVQAIDDEKANDEARNALEEDLEINNPEKLLNTVKKHNEERHKHRTYIRNFKYEAEILGVQKLYDIGLVW